jgi:hypothetical protein
VTLKAAIIVLGLLLLAGMVGRALAPRVDRRRSTAIEPAEKCPACGAYAVAGATCGRADCTRDPQK